MVTHALHAYGLVAVMILKDRSWDHCFVPVDPWRTSRLLERSLK